VAVEAACPAAYATDEGPVVAGTPALQMSCDTCECDAEATPFEYDRTRPNCSVAVERRELALTCTREEAVCAADQCGNAALGHSVRLVLSADGGQPDLARATCTVEDKVEARLCCRDALPERPEVCDRQAFPDLPCPAPDGARGPLLLRDNEREPAICVQDAIPGGPVFQELEIRDAACAPCPCQAEVSASFCDAGHQGGPVGCVATGAQPVCTTACLVLDDPDGPEAFQTDVRLSMTVARSNEAPAVSGGTCEPVNPRWVCDPVGALFP
jgi:hypothetical protein